MKTKTTAQTLATITGARTCEVTHITPECITRNADDRMYCHFDGKEQHTKGGRTRDALVAKKNEQQLFDLIDNLDPVKPIVSKIPRNFSSHDCRKQYAAELYRELASDKPTSIYHSRIHDKALDREALKPVAESLGFSGNHPDVVVKTFGADM